jgi:HK97 family phage major capsid protein
MTINVRELRARRTDLVKDIRSLSDAAELEDRGLTDDEQAIYDDKVKTVKQLEIRIGRLEEEGHIQEILKEKKAPNQNIATSYGDSESRAYAHWLRTGDRGALQQRASNAVDMVVGTDAAGGYSVPEGHYRDIIARRDESALFNTLGVLDIPGVGTTVNVPIDNEDNGEFVLTAEVADYDLDSPALGQAPMTLAKYTKDVTLSEELLEDEDSRLLPFLANFVGRGMAKTENNLLITEAATNGTSLVTFASNAAIAVGELEQIVYDDNISFYLDDTVNSSWIMRPSTFGSVVSITGEPRTYAETPAGSFRRSLLNYPVSFSNKAAAIATTATSVYFGNWNYMGRRQAPGFTVLRDPYSLAKSGQVVFHYYFRTVYKVLQAEAIGYGEHAV